MKKTFPKIPVITRTYPGMGMPKPRMIRGNERYESGGNATVYPGIPIDLVPAVWGTAPDEVWGTAPDEVWFAGY
jgi:hypothetical protein